MYIIILNFKGWENFRLLCQKLPASGFRQHLLFLFSFQGLTLFCWLARRTGDNILAKHALHIYLSICIIKHKDPSKFSPFSQLLMDWVFGADRVPSNFHHLWCLSLGGGEGHHPQGDSWIHIALMSISGRNKSCHDWDLLVIPEQVPHPLLIGHCMLDLGSCVVPSGLLHYGSCDSSSAGRWWKSAVSTFQSNQKQKYALKCANI